MMEEIIGLIRNYHRQQRFTMKMQSRIDRSVEAFIRVNVFGFSPDMSEDDRDDISKKTIALVRQCRKGEVSDDLADIVMMVMNSDASRACWDEFSAGRKRAMEKLAKQLPAAEFIKSTAGAGLHGFAQIVGEAGDLSNYANPAKLWKRLGLAPYDGLAMSSWKRETWRPRKLSSEEWIDNPFKAERYAIIAQIAQWLWVAQWIGKEKDPEHKGKPNGPYGEVYAKRMAHTLITHPEWDRDKRGNRSLDEYGNEKRMHAHKDALRIMMKEFIKDLWVNWNRAAMCVKPILGLPDSEQAASHMLKPMAAVPPAPIQETTATLEPKCHVSPEQQKATSSVKSMQGLPSAAPISPATIGLKSRSPLPAKRRA